MILRVLDSLFVCYMFYIFFTYLLTIGTKKPSEAEMNKYLEQAALPIKLVIKFVKRLWARIND